MSDNRPPVRAGRYRHGYKRTVWVPEGEIPARRPEDAAKAIADLQAEIKHLQGAIDNIRELITEELNQEPPPRLSRPPA